MSSHLPEEGGSKRRTYKKRNHLVVGKVFANWCGHCAALKPEWLKMKGILKKRKHGIEYVEIDTDRPDKPKKLADMKTRFGVDVEATGYPTLFKIEEDKLDYYNGPRTAEQMAEWYLNGTGKPNHYGVFKGGYTKKRPMSLYEMRMNARGRKSQKRRKTAKKSRFFFW